MSFVQIANGFWFNTETGDGPLVKVGGNYFPAGLNSETVGELTAEGYFSGRFAVNKFGRNSDVDSAEDIWSGGGDYTGFPAAADEFQILSDNVNDTAAGTGARTVRCYYLDSNKNMFDSNNEPLYFDATLNGTTPVNTGTSGTRVWRYRVLTAGSGLTNTGNISVRQRNSTSNVFAVIPAGFGQAQLSNFTIPLGYEGHLFLYNASMLDQNANSALVALKTYTPEGVLLLQRPFAVATTFSVTRNIYGGILLDALTDFVFRALSVANTNADITVSYSIVVSEPLE